MIGIILLSQLEQQDLQSFDNKDPILFQKDWRAEQYGPETKIKISKDAH